MAVYKRGYEPYGGRLTPEWARCGVIARYAWKRVLDSKFLVFFLVVSTIPSLVEAAIIYAPHNKAVIAAFGDLHFLSIDGHFFYHFLNLQATFAYLLTAMVGPTLVSRDLVNNGLPLYFCRPFSRTEYVLGKAGVLLVLQSLITWIPGLLLFGFQAYLEGPAWLWENLWIGRAIFLGSWIWILILSLMALAVSAWMKWRLVAAAVILAVFFVAAGFGEAFNNILDSYYGELISVPKLIAAIWSSLFRIYDVAHIPAWSAWIMMGLGCGFCLYLLNRRLRAFEVVRA